MQKTLLIAALALLCSSTAAVRGDENLFSDNSLKAAFSKEDAQAEKAKTRTSRKQVDNTASTLQTSLLAAGFNPKTIDGQTALTVTEGEWSADVIITPVDNARRLKLTMRLTDGGTVTDATLRQLLQNNATEWAAAFAVNSDTGRIELVQTIVNDSFLSQTLRNDFAAMTKLASKTRSLWDTNSSSTTSPPPSTTTTTTTTSNSTPATVNAQPSLEGTWVASPSSNEAFALKLDNTGTFKLVHVKDSNTTKSTGKFTLTATTLMLNGDKGTKIAGTLTRQSNAFTLSLGKPNGGSVTLSFAKGK